MAKTRHVVGENGRERYDELLALARAMAESGVAAVVKEHYLRTVLADARRCSFEGHIPIVGVPMTPRAEGPGFHSIGDSDPGTSIFTVDEADCLYIDFPPYAFALYMDHLFETGALKRGDAMKRMGTSGSGLRDTLNIILRHPRGMRFNDFQGLCKATGRRSNHDGVREFIAVVRDWYLANESRIEWHEPPNESG